MTLYSKSKCSICCGTKKSWYGYGCPYCDDAGTTYLEASHKIIIDHTINKLPEDIQSEIYRKLKAKFDNKT